MKKSTNLTLVAFIALLMCFITSCSKKTYMATLAPEESGLNVIEITDESKNTVLGVALSGGHINNAPFSLSGTNKQNNISWNTVRALSVSPDGDEIAYMNRVKGQQKPALMLQHNVHSATLE